VKYLGPHACEEALERGELQTMRIAPGAWERCARLRLAARERGVVVHREPLESLDRRSQGQRHQGVLGEGEAIGLAPFEALLDRVRARGPRALVLVLDGISDPHNFGAILRSAAGAGADGVVFPERRSAQVNETVIRASAGTAGRVPLVRVVNLARALGCTAWRRVSPAATTWMNLSIARPCWCWVPKGKGCTRRSANTAMVSCGSKCPEASKA